MKKLLTLLFLAFLSPSVSQAVTEDLQTTYNPFTGRMDYVIIMTSNTLPTDATGYIQNRNTLQVGSTWFVAQGRLNDNANITFGTGSDATIDYDGTNLVIDPDVVGSGVVSLAGEVRLGSHNTATQILYIGSDNNIEADSEFIWDTSNGRLGVLNSSPDRTLDVAGDADIEGTLVIGAGTGDVQLFFNGSLNLLNITMDDSDGDFDISAGINVTGKILGSASGLGLDIQNTANAASNQVSIFRSGNRVTPTDDDEGFISLFNDDSTETQVEFSRITFAAADVSNTTKDGRIEFATMAGNTLTTAMWMESGLMGLSRNLAPYLPTANIDIRDSGNAELAILETATNGFRFRYINASNRFEFITENGGSESTVMNWERINTFTNIGDINSGIAQLSIQPFLTTTVGVGIKLASSQTADAFQVLTSGSVELFGIESNGKTQVRRDSDSISGSNVDVSELGLIVIQDNDATGEAVGIGFAISSVESNIGAAIIHERTGGTSQGHLHFATKGASGGGANIPIRVTVTNSGNLAVGTLVPVSLLESDGPIGLAILTVTGNTTLDGTHSTLLANASGNITITLPTAASAFNSADGIGRIYEIKKIDSDGDLVTIDGNGAEEIEFATTAVLTTQGEAITIQSNGTAWFIL